MSQVRTEGLRAGTSRDLVNAAGLGARIAARRLRAEGLTNEQIRREIVTRSVRNLMDDGFDDRQCETLIAAVQRAIDEVVSESAPHPFPGVPGDN